MQLLPKALTLVFVDFQEFVELMLSGSARNVRRRGQPGRAGETGRCGRRFDRLQFEMVAHSIGTPGRHSEKQGGDY